MLRLAAAFEYARPLTDTTDDLRACLQRQHGVSVRRVNRFTELALLGALGLRAGASAVKPDSALYLASEAPMLADCAKALRGLVEQQRPPTPFEFMNISGNMAGFYIAQQFALSGPQLAVNRKGASLEAVMELLQIGFAAHRRALLGYVEEGVWPLTEHRVRLGLPADAPLAECSHWLYFDAECNQPLGTIEANRRFASAAEARAALRELARGASHLALGTGIAMKDRQTWQDALPLAPFGSDGCAALPHSNGYTAQALCRYALAPTGTALLHLNSTPDGNHYAWVYRPRD